MAFYCGVVKFNEKRREFVAIEKVQRREEGGGMEKRREEQAEARMSLVAHYNEIKGEARSLKKGDPLTFELGKDAKSPDKITAVNVQMIAESGAREEEEVSAPLASPWSPRIQALLQALREGGGFEEEMMSLARGGGETNVSRVFFPQVVEPILRILRRDVKTYLPGFPEVSRFVHSFMSERSFYLTPKQRKTLEGDLQLLQEYLEPEEEGIPPNASSPPPPSSSLERIASRRVGRLILVLDGVRDVGNVAAIYRTCDALGVQDVWRVLPDNQKTFRFKAEGSSRRADRFLSRRSFKTQGECVQALRDNKCMILASDLAEGAACLHFGSRISDALLPTGESQFERLALVVGEESYGVSKEMREASDLRVFLPMSGVVQSLNVSVAAALMLQILIADVDSNFERGLPEAKQKEVLSQWKDLMNSRTSRKEEKFSTSEEY